MHTQDRHEPQQSLQNLPSAAYVCDQGSSPCECVALLSVGGCGPALVSGAGEVWVLAATLVDVMEQSDTPYVYGKGIPQYPQGH